MNIGTSELIAIIALIGGSITWLNSQFSAIDKRFDKINQDVNGLGSRVSIFEEGTCELLGEQINQLKSKLYDLENRQ